MKNKKALWIFTVILIGLFVSCRESKKTNPEQKQFASSGLTSKFILPGSEIEIFAIQHGSAIIREKELVIYIDPVGPRELYEPAGSPDYILITDIHPDHVDAKLLAQLQNKSTRVIAPQAVIAQLNWQAKDNIIVLKNGEEIRQNQLIIKAIPMYNLTKERAQMHVKGRGNGYVLSLSGKNIYFSGDTEDIKEMRELKNIDLALVCMNLPYTMTEAQAASAVLEFKPRIVIPYHYRGKDGFSDIHKFESLVTAGSKDITVKFLNWYPAAQ